MTPNPFFVLVVDADPAAASAWRAAVPRARLGRQLYLVGTSSEAVEYILKVRHSPSLHTPGVVAVECARDAEPLTSIARWLRTQESLAWVVPIALVDGDPDVDVAPYYQAGARSCLRSPGTVEERAAVLQEIRAYWETFNVWPG